MRDRVKQPSQYYKQHLLKDALFENTLIKRHIKKKLHSNCDQVMFIL